LNGKQTIDEETVYFVQILNEVVNLFFHLVCSLNRHLKPVKSIDRFRNHLESNLCSKNSLREKKDRCKLLIYSGITYKKYSRREIKEEMDKIASLHNDLSIRIYLLVSHKEIEESYLQSCHEARDTIYNLQKKLLKAL